MDEPSEHADFYGVLGRATLQAGQAELRFYPFVFSTTPDAKCVFVAKFDAARFQETEIASLIGQEVEVTLFPDRAELFDPYDGEVPTILAAGSVAAAWSAYDTQDFMEHAIRRDGEVERLGLAYNKAFRKDLQGLALTQELMRRARIKAAASDDHKARQAAAIAVLERLLAHFESKD
ncbi:MAG: hypothetical protein Q7U72_13130 [Brevundimonas sp.]|uniref:hypothetical protein n=1 Tax=Brevundimonas sp. TaxID=1871086 RepID=UPI002724E45B|nr:hypothetical protein [Brevundimonas sp.]MDO9078375.1 hypothetical protein [Brevundimonas sp.]MDP3370954.1 hypothetical protein [Brevundimonas sp.]MDZ4059576.1 hypothetical protein [Brevundimonas sp.]